MRISDWSSDVCSSDLLLERHRVVVVHVVDTDDRLAARHERFGYRSADKACGARHQHCRITADHDVSKPAACLGSGDRTVRSEEHTSELQSLMRISYAVFCLKKKKVKNQNTHISD